MAEVNKSQAIRDYFKANKKAKTQEVIDTLAKKGITVTPNLVTTVKSKHNNEESGGEEGRCQGRSRHPRGQSGLGFHQAHWRHYGGKAGFGRGAGDPGDRVGPRR